MKAIFPLATACVGLSLILSGPSLRAESDYATGVAPYVANDTAVTQSFFSYDVNGNDVYGWEAPSFSGGNLYITDLDGNGMTIPDGDKPMLIDNSFNSFTTFDSSTNSVWVGFTGGDADGNIYSIDLNAGANQYNWTLQATLGGNYATRITGGNVFVSGTNGGSGNGIWLLDTSGNNAHDLIIDVGGNSGGFDFDSAGNLYYGSADVINPAPYEADGELLSFDADDISSILIAIENDQSFTSLTRGDGILLADLPDASSSVAVDGDDNVYFTITGSTNVVAVWDGNTGASENYDTVAEMDNFPGGVDAEGNPLTGGTLYVNDIGFSSHLVAVVPEPASASLLMLGGLGFLGWRRRKNS